MLSSIQNRHNDIREINMGMLPFVGPASITKLARLEIVTVWDLFHHIPYRFLDFSNVTPIAGLQMGDTGTVSGQITKFINLYTRKGKPMQILTLADASGTVDAVWFNQLYLSRTFREGDNVSLGGKLDWMGRKRALISPEYEIVKLGGKQIHTKGLIPIYHETSGISSKWLRRRIYEAWEKYGNTIVEYLPKNVIEKYELLALKDAIYNVHFPKNMELFEKARYRLAFDELLNLHTINLNRKKKWQGNRASKLNSQKTKVNDFLKTLPFELTESQNIAVNEILSDLQKDIPMNRLLEGDVGSGKTVVAAIAAYLVFLNGKKTLVMAPTQILAGQHFKTLSQLFGKDVRVGLITSTAKVKDLSEYDILVGTHALLNMQSMPLRGKDLAFKGVALVVIDEQHKFGVEQRGKLVKKSGTPHVLAMTATPIPRTVALTFFGDMDLSVLKELPKNRQRITTWIVPEAKRNGAYGWIKRQIAENKSQVFVVCPLIELSESETMKDIKNVNTEFSKLTKIFEETEVSILHGKLKAHEKENVIEEFKNGEKQILVTTPVVEVGIDIPNATIMMIEASDRFGLASLHQLRGRVGRGVKKSYCLLMTENTSERVKVRLTALTKKTSGFELAELDLKMRGPGEIFGTRQSGIPELKIADWSDVELIKKTREVAQKLIR